MASPFHDLSQVPTSGSRGWERRSQVCLVHNIKNLEPREVSPHGGRAPRDQGVRMGTHVSLGTGGNLTYCFLGRADKRGGTWTTTTPCLRTNTPAHPFSIRTRPISIRVRFIDWTLTFIDVSTAYLFPQHYSLSITFDDRST